MAEELAPKRGNRLQTIGFVSMCDKHTQNSNTTSSAVVSLCACGPRAPGSIPGADNFFGSSPASLFLPCGKFAIFVFFKVQGRLARQYSVLSLKFCPRHDDAVEIRDWRASHPDAKSVVFETAGRIRRSFFFWVRDHHHASSVAIRLHLVNASGCTLLVASRVTPNCTLPVAPRALAAVTCLSRPLCVTKRTLIHSPAGGLVVTTLLSGPKAGGSNPT